MIPNVRPMQQKDIDQVYAIELVAHRAPWSREILSDCVLVGYDCRVAEITVGLTKQIVGYIICRQSFNVCHILNLCISPSEQRKGYGELLLRTVLNFLDASPFNSAFLEVRRSNSSAIKLYKKLGFRKDSVKKAYYKDEKKIEDAIVLKKP